MNKWLILPIAAPLVGALPAHAQINVYIGTAPPPIRYEVRPSVPYFGAHWVTGYWAPDRGHYHWISGRYERAPFENASWSQGRWEHENNGWRYLEGKWNRNSERPAPEDYEGKGRGKGHAYGHEKERGHDRD